MISVGDSQEKDPGSSFLRRISFCIEGYTQHFLHSASVGSRQGTMQCFWQKALALCTLDDEVVKGSVCKIRASPSISPEENAPLYDILTNGEGKNFLIILMSFIWQWESEGRPVFGNLWNADFGTGWIVLFAYLNHINEILIVETLILVT